MKDKEFLKTIYEQSNQVYINFVNVRFQMFGLFALNAVLFDFLDKHNSKNINFIIVGCFAIFFTWVLFFIDRRNRHIFRRAVKIAEKIEDHLEIPKEMRLHTKSNDDLKHKISHSRIFVFVVITFTISWILFIIFHKLIIN
ncbi:MAG: hypothetical protein NTZ33_14635 [Bacteroidetes bacterium]|nr:hypothetical protein [Bacteroidota bacterium]